MKSAEAFQGLEYYVQTTPFERELDLSSIITKAYALQPKPRTKRWGGIRSSICDEGSLISQDIKQEGVLLVLYLLETVHVGYKKFELPIAE